jgi:hypothetical protein
MHKWLVWLGVGLPACLAIWICIQYGRIRRTGRRIPPTHRVVFYALLLTFLVRSTWNYVQWRLGAERASFQWINGFVDGLWMLVLGAVILYYCLPHVVAPRGERSDSPRGA